jgi:drug/metabolite transporter (DMT)-like permease
MDHLLGVFLIVVSAVSFGAMPIFACLAYDAGANPITVLFLRFIIASIIMAVVMAVQRIPIPRGRTLVTLILMGAIGYVSLSFTYFSALTMAPVGLVVILFYIYPSLVTLQAALFLNSPITKIKIAALLLSFAGIALVVGLDFGGAPTLGVALGVASAVIFSIYMIVGSIVISKTDSFSASTIVIIAAAVVFGIIVALKGIKFPTTFNGWIAVFAISLISTALGFVTLFAGLKRIDPANASMIYTLDPVVSVVLAVIVLGEPMAPVKIFGGVMILVAATLVARSDAKFVKK